jgi:hypothetical protein
MSTLPTHLFQDAGAGYVCYREINYDQCGTGIWCMHSYSRGSPLSPGPKKGRRERIIFFKKTAFVTYVVEYVYVNYFLRKLQANQCGIPTNLYGNSGVRVYASDASSIWPAGQLVERWSGNQRVSGSILTAATYLPFF